MIDDPERFEGTCPRCGYRRDDECPAPWPAVVFDVEIPAWLLSLWRDIARLAHWEWLKLCWSLLEAQCRRLERQGPMITRAHIACRKDACSATGGFG